MKHNTDRILTSHAGNLPRPDDANELLAARDTEEAVALANGTRYGLAASVWTGDVSTAHRVARKLRAGTVWVNTFDASDVITPFGGFGDSGSGRDKSLHALDAYTALKTTWINLA